MVIVVLVIVISFFNLMSVFNLPMSVHLFVLRFAMYVATLAVVMLFLFGVVFVMQILVNFVFDNVSMLDLSMGVLLVLHMSVGGFAVGVGDLRGMAVIVVGGVRLFGHFVGVGDVTVGVFTFVLEEGEVSDIGLQLNILVRGVAAYAVVPTSRNNNC